MASASESNIDKPADESSAASSSTAATVVEVDGGKVLSIIRGEICESELPNTVTKLTGFNGARVYLVGTAHFSAESCDDVLKTMRTCQPDILMLELCESRTALLQLKEEEMSLDDVASPSFEILMRCVRQRGTLLGVLNFALSILSQRLSARLGRVPGGEFRAAYRESNDMSFCRIHLGDRPIQTTFQRLLARLSSYQKIRLLYHIAVSDMDISPENIEEMKNKSLLEQLLSELGEQFPAIVEVVVEERDRYMAYQLQCLCREQPIRRYGNHLLDFNGQPPVIVAVLGIGHVKGIAKMFHERITDIMEIANPAPVPPPSRTWRYAKTGLYYSVLFYGTYRIGRRFLPSSVVSWVAAKWASIPFSFR